MRRLVFLLIIGIAGCVLLVSLGNWQVRRLAWKEEVLADITAKIAAAPVALPVSPTQAEDKYLPVVVAGRFDAGEIHVLVSVKQIGAGYRIIAPFLTNDGRRVLVDRGFVPTPDKGAVRDAGPMQIEGNLHWPREIDGYTPDPDLTANIWFARDVPAMAAALQAEPFLLIARSQTDPDMMPLPVDTAGIPNDHLQYAVTWYGLALVWTAMTFYFLWRTRSRARPRSEET